MASNQQQTIRLVGTDRVRATKAYADKLRKDALGNGLVPKPVKNEADLHQARCDASSADFCSALLDDISEFIDTGENSDGRQIDRFLTPDKDTE